MYLHKLVQLNQSIMLLGLRLELNKIKLLILKKEKESASRIQNAWGWCTGMTQRDGMGREVGGGFRTRNTCTPVEDSC